MSLGYDEIAANLIIYERDFTRYTCCLARGNEVQVSGRPEEPVRQAMLYHILKDSGLCPKCVSVKAETQSLDIALYGLHADERFRLLRPPLAIIEVKRRGSNLLYHEQQLLDYLALHRGGLGFLYNGDALIAYERQNEQWVARQLNTLCELGALVEAFAGQDESDLETFLKATDGDFPSFLALAQAHGKHTTHTFTFTLKGNADPIAGCCFRVKQGVLQYDVCGMFTVKQVPRILPDQFGKLISVIY